MASDLNIDLANLAEHIRAAGAAGPRAAALAINGALELARSDAARHIAQRYTLPPSYVEYRLKIPHRARESRLAGSLQARRRPTKFNQFKNTQKWKKGKTVARKRAGIDVKIKTGGPTHHWGNAFYIRLKNGNTGIAVRNDGPGNAIDVKYSTSVGAAFRYVRDETDLTQRMMAYAKTEFFRYMEKQNGHS